MRTDKQRTGDYGEAVAARYLRRHFYRILARNWHADKKEIDIIAVRFGIIAFVEVKTRTYTDAEYETLPPPRRAVDREKQHFTRAAAMHYQREHPSGGWMSSKYRLPPQRTESARVCVTFIT